MKQLLIGSVCCMLMGLGGASGAVYTFDGWDGITDYFSVNGYAGAYTIGDGNGLSGTDGVAFTTAQNAKASLVLQTPVAAGVEVSMGIYFHYTTRTFGGGDYFSLGIGKTANYIPNTGGTNDHVRVLLNASSGGLPRLGLEVVDNGTRTINHLGGVYNEGFTDGNWYHMRFTMTYDEDNELFGVTAQLYESNANGVLGDNLLNYAPVGSPFSLPGLASASQWYGYMSIDTNPEGRGLSAMDNFSMIPEPGVGLLMLAGLGVTAFARRKAE